MLKTIKRVIGCVAISLVMISCVQDVIMDAKDEPQVVVDCILCDEPVQTLYLVYTKGASQETASELTDAVAVLTDLTEGREIGRFHRTTDGSWELAYAAIPAHSYRLEVSVPDHELIWAEQTMPEVPRITSKWKTWQVKEYPFYKDDHGIVFGITAPQNPVWFYGINYPTLDSSGEITPQLCTDYRYVDQFNIVESNDLQGYTVKDVERFWGNDWFRFTTYPDLEGLPLHKQFLRFPTNEDLYETYFLISGTFQGCMRSFRSFYQTERRPAELHYFAASDDYDKYLKDSYHLLGIKTSSDMADIFVRDNVYSNIQGGAIGLFGAKIEKKLDWDWTEEALGAQGLLFFPAFADIQDELFQNQGAKYLLRGNDLFHYIAEQKWASTPFELLKYEVRMGYIPAWAPELPSHPYNPFQKACETYIIQDEGQLVELGLGDCGPIDFSKKTVLLVNYTEYGYCRLPIYIAQGSHGGIETRIMTVPYPNVTSANAVKGAFRIAILVDKLYETNFMIHTYLVPTEDYSDLIYQAFKDISGYNPQNRP